VTATGDEQNPGQRRDLRLASVGVDLVDWVEEPPKPAGVVVHADRADLRQGDTAGMPLADPDHRGAAPVLLVAEPEAVAAAALALASGEANPLALVLAKLGPAVGRQGVTEVYCGLLKDLRRYVLPPG
jgi:hypothetical protein